MVLVKRFETLQISDYPFHVDPDHVHDDKNKSEVVFSFSKKFNSSCSGPLKRAQKLKDTQTSDSSSEENKHRATIPKYLHAFDLVKMKATATRNSSYRPITLQTHWINFAPMKLFFQRREGITRSYFQEIFQEKHFHTSL